jgi:hypothetical protein
VAIPQRPDQPSSLDFASDALTDGPPFLPRQDLRQAGHRLLGLSRRQWAIPGQPEIPYPEIVRKSLRLRVTAITFCHYYTTYP